MPVNRCAVRIARILHLRAEQACQPLVAFHPSRRRSAINRHHRQPRTRGGRRGRPHVVGLGPTARHQRVRVLRQRIRQEELQTAHLVPTQPQAGQVIALDPDLRPLKGSAQPWGGHERRRQEGQGGTRDRRQGERGAVHLVCLVSCSQHKCIIVVTSGAPLVRPSRFPLA